LPDGEAACSPDQPHPKSSQDPYPDADSALSAQNPSEFGEPTAASSEDPQEDDPLEPVPPQSEAAKEQGSEAPLGWQAPFLDFLCTLTRHRVLLTVFVFLGFFNGYRTLKTTPSFFRSSAVVVLLPREKPLIDATIDTGSLETTQDVARKAGTASLTLPAHTELYVTLLLSRPVLERLGIRYEERLKAADDLQKNPRSDELVTRIKDMISITGTEEGMMTITVTANDAELAAAIANDLVTEGEEASKSVERQLILQQAGFLDEAHALATTNMRLDEHALRNFKEKHQLTDPGMQTSETMGQIGEAMVARDSARVELSTRLLHFTEQDPGVRTLRETIAVKEARIQELQNTLVGNISTDDYASTMIQFESLKQRVRFRQDLSVALSTQADIFRIRADQPAGNIAVIREAVPAGAPAGPAKKKTIALSLGASLFMGIFLCILLEQFKAIKHNPYLKGRYTEIKKELFSLPIPVVGRLRGSRERDESPL
jgi:capsule polysaccharide export protein KpsE/RkpR